MFYLRTRISPFHYYTCAFQKSVVGPMAKKKITSSRVPTLYKNQPFSVFNVRLSFLQCVKPLDWFEKKRVRTFAECIEECNEVCHRLIVTGFVCKEVICYPVLNLGTFLFLNMTLPFDRSRGVTKFLRSSLLVCTEYILN